MSRRSDGTHRVAITGVGIECPLGSELDAVSDALKSGRHGIRRIDEYESVDEMITRLGAPALGIEGRRWPRKKVRSMGRVALLATAATESALADAGVEDGALQHPRTGLAYGSTHGSSKALEGFARTLNDPGALLGLGSNTYLKFMSHTCAVNLAIFFGIRGRVQSTCSACVSASQAIGAGYEAIRYGLQDVMICGGAEELHWVSTGVFDVLQATSIAFNERPDESPRPFDRDRDGLVIGEGAATLVLERWENATRRGATIYGELTGFGTSCDGTHITAPSPDGMETAMRLALEDAHKTPDSLNYINAHATATDVGDRGESEATHRVFGDRVPVSSTKSYTGHTLGACGAIETIFGLAMLRDGFVAPNRNLDHVDPACAPLDYLRGDARDASIQTFMNNNFAFGGINTSLIVEAR
ncbi:MAG: beta-ketoacyl-ACP synthase [Myxococcota bacterium]